MATPQPGYLLGVDLGTSNTVAVIRWPDGRVRPLLVDGTHVMPSSVFLDESGHIHVGRDAQRLALTAPERYEPNPKQRTEEDTVLLGGREVPVVALLTAILRAVADKAVETVGFLPPAILTHPAKWTARRRDLLQDAAAKAGFPPVKLVPEPIAAAHYFAALRPIPVNSSVAVFDFGGGTLDVAVVRDNGAMGFSVLGDGGLPDLGGLDVDAALIQHLGRTIAHNAPDLWRRLESPQSPTDKRSRRQFWDDVRGAKEMLSRTTVAPVPVPTVDISLHLTRDELEGLATPLLDRAINETIRVIQAAGLTPQHLQGLYLVGGASRIPLVARLLHQRLGVAPIVLEQPELPVAEGALGTRPQQPAHNPMTPPHTDVPVSPAGPEPYTPPHGAEEPFIQPIQHRPLWKQPVPMIAAAVVLVLAVVGGWWLMRDKYPQEPMHQLAQVGTTVPLTQGATGTPMVEIENGMAYFFTPLGDGKSGELTKVDMATGAEKWRASAGLTTGSSWKWLWAQGDFLMLCNSNGGNLDTIFFIDTETGEVGKSVQYPSDEKDHYILNDRLVLYSAKSSQITGYDANGEQVWSKAWKGGVQPAQSWEETSAAAHSTPKSPGLLIGTNSEKQVAVWDATTGEQQAMSSIVKSDDDQAIMLDGKVYMTSGAENYALTRYEDDLSAGPSVQVSGKGKPEWLTVCGEKRLCVFEKSDKGDSIAVFELTDKGAEELWRSDPALDVTEARPVGESLVLTVKTDKGDTQTLIYDKDMEAIGTAHANRYHMIDSGSLLQYPDGTFTGAEIRGLGAQDGVETVLGSVDAKACEADAAILACAGKAGYTVHRFRD